MIRTVSLNRILARLSAVEKHLPQRPRDWINSVRARDQTVYPSLKIVAKYFVATHDIAAVHELGQLLRPKQMLAGVPRQETEDDFRIVASLYIDILSDKFGAQSLEQIENFVFSHSSSPLKNHILNLLFIICNNEEFRTQIETLINCRDISTNRIFALRFLSRISNADSPVLPEIEITAHNEMIIRINDSQGHKIVFAQDKTSLVLENEAITLIDAEGKILKTSATLNSFYRDAINDAVASQVTVKAMQVLRLKQLFGLAN